MNEYGFDYLNYITNIPSNMMNLHKHDMDGMQKHKKNDNTVDPYQGFIKGNLFDNLYEPYKNYKPQEIDASNERETLLYQIMQYKFALIELNLYLDTNPNDRNAIELYNKYLEIEKKMSEKYENMYGPLTVSNTMSDTSWKWINSPWPWEVM